MAARTDDARTEILRLGGRNGEQQYAQLMRAAEAYDAGRDGEAVKTLQPLRDQLPEAAAVRELLGLSLYREGRYGAAAEELEDFAKITGSIDQVPVLMDCYRAQRHWKKVAERFQKLQTSSPPPSGALATEGRIVAAGALADQGKLDEALTLLRRKDDEVKRPKEHHLRLWYALADLEERAGDLPRARALFDRIVRAEPRFADAASRRAALG
ncbi:MAG: tetratricopeptide repeat protein [Acidimicrobiia bacterium]